MNLSGTAAPLAALKLSFALELRKRGLRILDENELEKFIVRNRVRYTAGIDEVTAQALKKETGVDAVLIISLELFNESMPPKVALTSRLVSTGETPSILWVDGVGLAGDDAPGLLGLGLIEEPTMLADKAVGKLSQSLVDHLSGGTSKAVGDSTKGRFQPKIAYRSPELEQGKRHTIAIAPFFNESERKNAGEMVVLQFMRGLSGYPDFDVIEPGLVRKAFLNLRIIMDEGVSLSDAGLLFGVLNADLVLTGKVFDYQDYQGVYGKPKVKFSVQLIERKSQKVVWSSMSRNEGDDSVYFFDVGRVNTAYAMAAKMVNAVDRAIYDARSTTVKK